MAYGLKYTQYLEKGGAQLQIRVYAKDWSGATYGMAHVTSASLQIIGGQSDVLTPYIKTAFSWSLADCWDEGSTKADGTQCVNAASEKCGRWEEFYTPDATKFRVELWAKTTPSATAVCIWKGFVTPDSWSENMIYRGSVTITARDMLGALQDKEFDLTGRVTVLEVIQGALAACECPMELDYTAAHFLVNENGTSILQHTFAASTFSGDNWQTVLQETLESLGLVLRYNGAGKLILTSLRYLAADTLSGSHGVEFISRSGLRELDPALKLITETFDVNFVAYNAPDPAASQFARNGNTLTCSLGQRSGKLYAYTLTRANGEGWAGGLAIPLYGTIGAGVQSRGVFFPTNAVTTGTTDIPEADYINPRLQRSFRFALKQDGPLVLASGSGVCDTFAPYNGAGYGIDQIGLRVEAVSSGGSTKYLNENGSWVDEITYRYVSLDEEVEVPDFGVSQGETFYYRIVLKDVSTKAATDNMRGLAPLLAALLLEVSPNTNSTVATEYKTTTVYNEDNNVTITRRPKIGCAAAAVDGCIDFYENVLALGQAIVADHWNWPGESSYYPLAVMIQAQALCFHAAAASVFTGTLHDKTTPEALAFPGCAYTYYERSCVPISGTFDFTSGFVAQTFIREVYSWEEVWGTFAPDYTQISGSGKGSTSATGSGGSSVSPGGGGGGGGGSTARSYFEEDLEDPGRINLKEQYDELALPDLLIGANNESLLADLSIIGASLQSLQAQLDSVASRDCFDELTATTAFIDTLATDCVYANRYYFTDDIYFYIDVVDGTPCVHLNADFITDGDQILGDGTPGGGGGGGVTYFSELQDVSAAIAEMTSQQLANKMLIWDTGATPVGGESATGAWSVIDKSSVGITTDATQNLHGLMSAADKTKLDGINTTYIANGETAYEALNVIGPALQSLQAQLDSVASRDAFDELTATAAFVDVLAAGVAVMEDLELAGHSMKNIPNDYIANPSITINGTSTALGGSFATANITAGTAGTSSATSGASFAIPYVTMNKYGVVTGYGTHTHTISQANLFGSSAIGSAALPVYYNGSALASCTGSSIFSDLSSGAATNLSATIAGQTRTATLYATYDSASENISDKFSIVGSALQSLQGQIDAVASRVDLSDYEATTEAKMDYICDLLGSLQAQIDSVSTRIDDGSYGYFDMLAVGGDIYADYIFTTGDQELSDERKKNITREIVLTAEQIASCRAVAFDWKDKPGSSFGSIAQDWQKILPESVRLNGDTLYLSSTKSAMVAVINLAREVVELRKQLEQRGGN